MLKLFRSLFALCLLGIIGPAYAATILWTNTAGGNWSGTANWSPNQIPTAVDDVYITNLASFTVTINTPANVSNLFLGNTVIGLTNRVDQNTNLNIHGVAQLNTTAWLRPSWVLGVSNRIENSGFVQWLDSPIRGNGRFINQTNGILHTRSAGGSTLGVRSFENYGYFLVGSDDVGVFFSSNTKFTNYSSGEVQINLPVFGIENASGATNTLFVNYGLTRATAGSGTSPTYLTVDILNFGNLRIESSAWYIGSGTNYGIISSDSVANDLSTLSADPFVFGAGTSFPAPCPRLYAGGSFIFDAPVTLNSTLMRIGNASGAASSITTSLAINDDFTFTGALEIGGGRLTITNPAANINLSALQLFDNGSPTPPLASATNRARITVGTYQQNVGTMDNNGLILVQTNLSFTGGNLRSGGALVISNLASISGTTTKTINGQIITNLGTVSASATVTILNGANWWNETNATYNNTGGTLDDNGTAGFFYNRGTVAHLNSGTSGGVDMIFTNAGGLVSCLGSTLTLTRFTQIAGRTELRGGNLSGRLDLQGGTLDGPGSVGSVVNSAGVLPGNGLGTITATGGFTNLATGIYQMQIGGTATNQYDRLFSSGTVSLAGTLNVTFTNGYFPTTGHSFTAMTWTARSGTFSNILTPSYEFEVIYQPTALVLRASNALPAINLTLPTGNSNFVCQPFQLAANANDLDGTITNLTLLFEGSPVASVSATSAVAVVEKDFPSLNTVIATAIDDRGGSRSITQSLNLVTAPLEVLTLGGVRSNVTFKVCMAGLPTTDYLLQGNTNLLTTNWVSLGLMERTNGIWRYFDANTITNRPARYYRAVRQ
jgi:hypothetical protein